MRRPRALVLATGVVAATPVIVSAARALSQRWTPVGDRAEIAARAFDVLSGHSPLLGQFSASSGVLGQDSYSLGPLLYWVLALPVRLGGAAPAVAIAVVNTACVMGTVALARRRGGRGLMVATAAAILLMSASLVSATYSDIWNPSAGLLPLLLLAFLAWSLACGEVRLLPLAVLVAGFVVQCHLAYVLPAAGLLAVGAAGLVIAHRRAPLPGLRRWAAAALVVTIVCWAAPVAEQLTHDPGNFLQIARSAKARQQTLGAPAGWHALVRTVGIPPWWLRPARTPADRLGDLGGPLGIGSAASAVLVLAGLLAAGVAGARRGRRDVAFACAAALAMCAAVALVAASTPSNGILFLSIGYTLWWASLAGMFAWLVLGWSLAALTGLGPRLGAVPLRARGAAAALALAAGLVVALAPGAGEDQQRHLFGPMRSVAAQIDAAVPSGAVVAVRRTAGGSAFDHRFDMAAGAVYALRRHGARPLAFGMEKSFGAWYAGGGRTAAATVHVGCASAPGRVIGRVPERGSCPVVVTLTSP
ncbi:MAG: hypothetical protein QOF37_2165 [Thermoleophilaceae bacterium]|nr:hypothetical protein [Thermoleophilaceae bacterium]